MIRIEARRGIDIPIGYVGENEARQIVFDIREWMELFGSGYVRLVAKRSGDAIPYPCDVKVEDHFAIWTVKNADVAHDGVGKCELAYIVNEQVVKSATYITKVLPSMAVAGQEAPEPMESWFEQIISAGEEVKETAEIVEDAKDAAGRHAEDAARFAKDAKQASETAKNSADRAEMASSNGPKVGESGTWLIWDAEASKYVDSGVAASGKDYVLTDSDRREIAGLAAAEVVYVQPDEPPESAPENSLWIDTDESAEYITRAEGVGF